MTELFDTGYVLLRLDGFEISLCSSQIQGTLCQAQHSKLLPCITVGMVFLPLKASFFPSANIELM